MADGGKITSDYLKKIAVEYDIREGTLHYFPVGHESGLGGKNLYFPVTYSCDDPTSRSFEETDAVFAECIANGLDPDEEFKRRIDKIIASLDSRDFWVLFTLVSEFYFQCKTGQLQAARDLCQVRDQYHLEQTS